MKNRSSRVRLLAMIVIASCGAGFGAETGTDPWLLWSGPTQLRGANIYQRLVYPELDGPEFMGTGTVGPPFVQQDFDRLAALGANYVNISHPGLFTEQPPYRLDADVQANLDGLLEMISQADMFAVISFRTGPGRSEFTFHLEDVGDWFDSSYLNDEVWTAAAAQGAWAAMWRHTAERYRDNPVVVGYDLMVEPNSSEVFFDEWDPQQFYADHSGTLYDSNPLFAAITTAIREVDQTTPILAGAMGYSAVDWLPWLVPSGDTRTVYVVHQYAPFVYTHQEPGDGHSYPGLVDTDWDGEPDTFDRAWLDELLGAVDSFAAVHGTPMAANEYGVMRWAPGAAQFMTDQMALLEQRGMNHALWAWEPSYGPWSEEVTAFNFRLGPDPDNISDVESSALLSAITNAWASNTVRPSSFATQTLWIPAAAHTGGMGGERWRTDVQLKASDDAAATVAIALLEKNADNRSPASAAVQIAAGESVRYSDILQTMFGFGGSAALRLSLTSGSIIASSRTYNDDPEGSFGQYIPAFAGGSALAHGVDGVLIQLSSSASSDTGFRTNIGFVNTTAGSIRIEVTLYRASPKSLGNLTYDLLPYEYDQVGDIFRLATADDVADGYAVVRTTTVGGAFFSYASVVDNRTGDAIYVPPQLEDG